MKFLFDLPVIYFSCVLACVVWCCVADPVDTMTDLLSYSGWRVLADPNDGLVIIDRRGPGQTDRQVLVNNLLAGEVTEENVAEKIRLSHQFLSCSYARELIDLCDYEKGFGPQCRSMKTASNSFDCLEDYLNTIRYKDPMVLRMIGALSSIQDLSPTQTQFQKAVFDVLVDMRSYYQHKTVVRPAAEDEQATQKTADKETLEVEKQAHLMSKRLFAFYNRFCWPISQCVKDNNCSKATHHVNELAKVASEQSGDHKYVCNVIKDEIKKIYIKFMEFYDFTSGFEYNPESKTSRIITSDPDIAVRVTKMNHILSNGKWWKSLGLAIRERGSYYWTGVEDLLRTDGIIRVTTENVYAKLKQAHLLLSCKYATILITCCGDATNMWSKCKESQDVVCLDKFLQILNDNDPSMELMIGALLYIQNLSPRTVYNKRVYESLKRFKGFLDERNARPRNVRNVSNWSPAIEKDLSEITQDADEFYNECCYPSYEFFDHYFADKFGDPITIDVIGKYLIRETDRKTKWFAVFKYTRINNTVVFIPQSS